MAADADPAFMKQYWFGVDFESDWKPGSRWKMTYPDGRVTDAGEVLEADPPKRLVLKWRNEFRPELTAEGCSRCTMELEPKEDTVKLTITHRLDVPVPESKFIGAVSGGWPLIMSNLKSLIETGRVAVVNK